MQKTLNSQTFYMLQNAHKNSMGTSLQNTVLIAENDINIRTALRMFLQIEGYKVIEATNGYHAVETAKTTHPDLILMNLDMPFLNGIEAALIIRRDPTLQQVPILASSSNGMYGIELFLLMEELGNGFIDYVTQPFDFSTLIKNIEMALRHSKLPA
jgi:two-component system, OmpR family, alkaline phosphatase synthesis response regulator PhoP